MKRKNPIIVCNIAIVLLEVVGLVYSILEYGWGMFRFYTQDSNFFAAFTSILLLVYLIKGKEVPNWLTKARYVAVLLLAITFIVTAAVLAPLYGEKYYIMFEIGVGTGMQLQDILKLKVKDVRDQDYIEAYIGTKRIKRTFNFSSGLKQEIHDFTEGKDPDSYLIIGHASSPEALSREQAYRALKSAGRSIGLSSIGAQTMRKTFAWRYYKETGDIYYLQNLLNHASPSITYRYIGEKPNVEVQLKKMTAEENERSRSVLLFDEGGKKRIEAIIEVLAGLEKELNNAGNNDAFYGKADCFLLEIEELIRNYQSN